MVEKRSLDDGAAASVPSLEAVNGVAVMAKKPKLDAKPSLSLEALEKAKKALQMQKELKEKLKNLPQRAPPPPGQHPAAGQPAAHELMLAATAKAAQIAARFGVSVTPAAPLLAAVPAQGLSVVGAGVAVGAPGYKPAPLLLDAIGRAVDEHGHVVNKIAAPTPTLRVNQQAASNAMYGGRPGNGSGLPLLAPPPIQELATDEFFDDRMGTAGLKKLNRKSRATFDFVQHGSFLQQAVDFRLRAKYGRDAKPRGPIGPIFAMGDPNQIPLGVNPNLMPLGAGSGEKEEIQIFEPLPAVEWWDKPLLATGTYEADIPADPNQPIVLKDGKITSYVEHPIPLQPPAEGAPPPPQPLKLTTRELKKLRTQRRQAREKEKQDLIRQGLLEPAKPKVKLSNLYRVLGEQAVADPTRLEMETKKQMKERAEAHEDRNLSRALTPAERREKKERKLFDDTGTEVITSVYKILRLDNSHHKYKVDINAKENHMSGVLLITPEFSIVVVEGCRKATQRYAKLMLRRIDWSEPNTNQLEDENHMEDVEEEKPPNRCDLVWQGLVRTAAFHGFKIDKCRAEQAVQIMTQRSVLHYWHAATNFVPGESVPVALE